MCAARRNNHVSTSRVGLLFLATASVAQSFSFLRQPSNNAFTGGNLGNRNIHRKRLPTGILAATSINHQQDADSEEVSFDPFHLQRDGVSTISSGEKIRENKRSSEGGDGGKDDVWKARLLLIVAAALYGTNFTVVKVLNESVPVGISTTLRFALAALATLPWLLAPPPTKPEASIAPTNVDNNVLPSLMGSSAAAAALAGLEVGAWNSFGYIAQAVGLETTDASKSAFICSLAVVVVPILDFLAGKKLLPREMIGAAMAVAGVGFLELGGGGGMSAITSGDLLSLVQPLAFGIGFWRMESAMHRFPEEASRITAAQIFAVFCSSSLYTFLGSGETLPAMSLITEWVTDPMIAFALFWTGCITTALTVYMETLALKTLSAAETTMIFSTEPLWGAAFASLVVGEHLGLGAGIGAALILSGCLFSNMGSLEWFTMSADDENEEDATRENTASQNMLSKTALANGAAFTLPTAAVAAEIASAETAASVTETISETLGNL